MGKLKKKYSIMLLLIIFIVLLSVIAGLVVFIFENLGNPSIKIYDYSTSNFLINISDELDSMAITNSTQTVLTLIILFIFLLLELLLYFKLKPNSAVKFPLIAVIYLFALGLNVSSISNNLPLTPMIQFFLIVFETVVFFITSVEYSKTKKRSK